MKRNKQAKKISDQMNEFFEKNPGIEEALRIFGIAYDQYQRALEGSHYFYTDTSTTSRADLSLKTKKSK